MDGMAAYELGKVLYKDRLRHAAGRERMFQSGRFQKLPRLVQFLVSALS